ncbi:Transmembrane protein [Salix suchowensis]|nr:Transmembrane protein [Salix suchowensis]
MIALPVLNSSLTRNLDVHFENFFKKINLGNKYGAMAATATVILTGIYIGWAYTKRSSKKPKKKVRRVLTRSMSVGVLHGGKRALDRVVDYHRARADEASLEAAERQFKDLLKEALPDFVLLQHRCKARNEWKRSSCGGNTGSSSERIKKEGRSHEAYEIEMLLVEMHIYQREFKKALDCDCLRHKAISDARRPLYKAIIYIMLEHPTEEASKYWDEFIDLRILFHSRSSEESQLNEVVTTVREFEKALELIRDDINEA